MKDISGRIIQLGEAYYKGRGRGGEGRDERGRFFEKLFFHLSHFLVFFRVSFLSTFLLEIPG